jgi:spermidine/putrescine ABC transporter ATP-binding subunit
MHGMAGIKGTALPVAIERVSKFFGKYRAVEEVSIDVEAGTIVSLLGPSGCGKTTVLRMVAGLETPDDGIIRVGNRVLNDVPVWKRGIGMVFQSYALFPHMTVSENIAFGLRMQGVRRAQAEPRVREAMDLTRLATMADRLPSQLSGGQRQRVALARALANSPQMLLLDEPMGALDKKLRDQMQVELKLLQRRVGLSTIMVTHDQDEALTLSDRVVVMSNGRVEQIATPEEIYRNPSNVFVADFIGAANLMPGTVAESADGEMTIRLATGHTVRASGAQMKKVGSSVTVMVRPENLKLRDAPDSASNTLAGRVSSTLFSGSNTIYVIEADERSYSVAVPSADRRGATVGELVHLVWSSEDTTVVSG